LGRTMPYSYVSVDNGVSWTRVAQNAPFGAYRTASMVVDSDLVITGGLDTDTGLTHNWVWKVANSDPRRTANWVLIPPKSGLDYTQRMWHAMGYLPVLDRYVISAGVAREQAGIANQISRPNVFVSEFEMFVSGDPQFVGIHGQSFQFHGIPDRCFSLLSYPHFNLNAHFTFLSKGRVAGEVNAIRVRAAAQKSASVTLPVTAPWTHPGTYFGQIGVQFGADKLYLSAGSYETGMAIVKLNDEIVPVAPGVLVRVGKDVNSTIATHFERVSSHEIRIHAALFVLSVVNSDHFFNLDRVSLSAHFSSSDVPSVDGLLGITVNRKITKITERMAFDYLLEDNDVFSHNFENNKFSSVKTQ